MNTNYQDTTKMKSEYAFQNKHFSFTVDKSGKVSEIKNGYNGNDILSKTDSRDFITLYDHANNCISPKSFDVKDNEISCIFEDGTELSFKVETFDNFMTFELITELPKSIKYTSFARLTTTLPEAEENEDFMLNAVGMTAWTNPVTKGYIPHAYKTEARAYSIYERGAIGAKLGIVFSKKANAIDYLKELMDAIDPKVGLTSKAGGAWAKDFKGNYGDYALVTNIAPEFLDKTLETAIKLDIDQFDVHQSAKGTFSQGDFRFAHTENGTAKEHRESAGKKINDAGLITSLHTYSFYVSPMARGITTVPKWQKQLETLESYTLAEDVDEKSTILPTVENCESFDASYNFFHKNTRYILVDEEIIKVNEGTSDGLDCVRGILGTTSATHKKGATVYHLSGYFGMLCPVLGSELFYHIADLTAKAYNEGGFDMLYFDAIDGLNKHLPSKEHETWYYLQMFIHRVVSQCERTPILETSAGAPSEWNVRGRQGAWDYPMYSFKKHLGNHVEANIKAIKTNMTTTMGWFTFYPDEKTTTQTKNTIEKTLFHDDIDYLGTKSIVYNMSMVYHPLDTEAINNNPFHLDNIMYFQKYYSKLRKANYFTPEVIKHVEKVGGEWRVIEKDSGEFAFEQINYAQAKLGNTEGDYTMTASNPFEPQTPFIRIEARYSSEFENPVKVAEFDNTKSLGEQELEKKFDCLDLKERLCMKLKVTGTGNDSDAALISLSGSVIGEKNGRFEHFIPLGFEGTKEFILLDTENAEYDIEKYKFDGIQTESGAYTTFRFVPDLATLTTLKVRLCGDTADKAVFGDITSFTHTDAPVKNPTVLVGDTKICFNCEMKGGEYLEYDPVTGKAILYHNAEQTKEEISFEGTLTVPSGEFNATYSAETLTQAPLRAKLTLGFIGEEIKNS